MSTLQSIFAFPPHLKYAWRLFQKSVFFQTRISDPSLACDICPSIAKVSRAPGFWHVVRIRAAVSSAERSPARQRDSAFSHAANRKARANLKLSVQRRLFCCVSFSGRAVRDAGARETRGQAHRHHDRLRLTAYDLWSNNLSYPPTDYLGSGSLCQQAEINVHLFLLRRKTSVPADMLRGADLVPSFAHFFPSMHPEHLNTWPSVTVKLLGTQGDTIDTVEVGFYGWASDCTCWARCPTTINMSLVSVFIILSFICGTLALNLVFFFQTTVLFSGEVSTLAFVGPDLL